MKQKSWSRMTKEEKRITTIKDTLAQLASKTIVLQAGAGYLSSILKGELILEQDHVNVKDVLPQITCQVCLKGALFFGHVSRHNNCFTNRYGFEIEEVDTKERLISVFSVLQLDMVEAAFECSVITDDTDQLETFAEGAKITELGEKCVKFGKRFKNDTNRFKAIMNNMLENKGIFTP